MGFFIISNNFLETKIKNLDNIYKAKTYSFHYYIPYPGTYKYDGNINYFNDRNWPNKIFDSNLDISNLKATISEYFGYPVNEYHTITPHNHYSTFKIINERLDEMEKYLNESN